MAKETAKAKKEREAKEAINGVTPVVLSAEEAKEAEKLLEPSGELVPIGNEFGTALGIETTKVNKYLLAFTPYVQGVVDLEEKFKKINFEEPTDEDVKLAKELKPLYKDLRLASDKTHKSEKESFVKEGRLLDKLKNAVNSGTSIKEEQLQKVLDYAENKENERIEALRLERTGLLEAQDYDATFLSDLGTMEEERFAKLLEAATNTKIQLAKANQFDEAEEQKKKDLAEKIANRTKLLKSIGFEFNEEANRYESPEGFIDEKAIEQTKTETFNKFYEDAKTKREERLKGEAEKVQAEKEKAEKTTNRINAITALGLTFDPALETYLGYEQKITLEQVKTLGADDFTKLFKDTKAAVVKAKDEAAKAETERKKKEAEQKAENERLKKAETERLAEEKRKKDEAEALKKAPDKEKFKAWYLRFKALVKEFPEFESETGKVAGKRFKEAVEITLKVAVEEAGKLV